MYMSVLCFHDFLLGLFAASPRDLRVHAACTKESFLTMGDEITEPISMESLGKEDCHETAEPSLVKRFERVRFESKGTSEQVDEIKQDIFVELEE